MGAWTRGGMPARTEGFLPALGRVMGTLLVLVLVAGCDEGSTPDPLTVSVEDGTQGHYGGPCSPDGSCGPGLVCEHHVCKESPD